MLADQLCWGSRSFSYKSFFQKSTERLNMKEKVRNLVIVGRTGCGKSTLANVLCDTENYFEESGGSVSITERSKKQYFDWNEVKYCVIDTVGVERTKLPGRKEIQDGINSVVGGISQVLFVIDGGFTLAEKKLLESLEKDISKIGIAKYITIVRTKFADFRSKSECEIDRQQLCEESEIIAKIVNSCSGVIHVDNPPIKIKGEDKEDPVELIEMNKKLRQKSRNKLLNYLEKECQKEPYKLKKSSDMIRNLVIVGRTGCGKSTLANVLSDTNDFEESVYSVSKTENLQKQVFECNGTKYCVVDIVGIGSTKLPDRREVWDRITKGISSVEGGISQVLFVIDGGFTLADKKMLESLEDISKSGIAKYITIVRTKFADFRSENECERDRQQLCEESEIIAKIVNSCSGVIHVDNPPIKIKGEDKEDPVELIEMNKKLRQKSRNKLLNYLEKKCQEKPYKLETWDKLQSEIFNAIIEALRHVAQLFKGYNNYT